MRRALGALVAVSLMSVGWAGVSYADQWKERGGDCVRAAFKSPGSASLPALKKCVRLFEAYKALQSLTISQKAKAIKAMRRLHTDGSNTDAHIARIGLRRLGVKVPARMSSDSGTTARNNPNKGATKRRKCSHPEPEKAERTKAQKEFRKGISAYRKKKFKAALAHFENMMKIAPGWPKSLRNAAGLNALTGNTERSLDLLKCLRDMATNAHIAQLRKARWDKDFASLRNNSDFKRITGYARIALVDTLKEGRGEENIDNLEELVEKLHYKIHTRKEGKGKEQTKPTIFFQDHSRVIAYLISKLIDHPGLKVTRMPEKYKEKNFDVIVLWGDRYKKGDEPKSRVPSPDDAENLLDDVARKEDEILRSPDKYERQLDDVLGKPGKVADKIGSIGDKAERVIEKPGEVLDKIEKIGDKLKNPF